MGGSVIPERFVATGTDTAVSITRSVTHHRIGMRLQFPGRLDPDRLARAVRLSLDAEPILGCAFRTDEFRPYWLRLQDPDLSRAFSVCETGATDREMDAFQADEVDDGGPQATVVVFRTLDFDEVGIKVSHVLADGQAVKQYAYRLADIYTRLGEDPSYVPTPNLTPRPTARDVWEQLTGEQRRDAKKAKSWSNPNWAVPFNGRTGRGLTYRTRALDTRQFAALRDYGHQRDATVNDLLLAAVFRACVREFDPPSGVPLSLMCTADHRRYLPNPDRMPTANISISGSLDIERVDGEAFDDTLGRVREHMDAWARTCYGAGPARTAERLQVLGYRISNALLGATLKMAGRSGKTYAYLTNIGVIDETRLSFDGQTPVACHVYGPAAIGPSIVVVASTYLDTLTMCMGFCAEDCESALVERVLASTADELIASVCSPGA